jgi:hypothetical protein
MYGNNSFAKFDVHLRAPLGYLCRIADARRWSPWTDDDDESGPPTTKQNSGEFQMSTRDQPRCVWEVDAFDDGDGNGIVLSFLISKDPNYNPSGWYKIVDGAFHKNGSLTMTYPSIVNPYDTDDNGKVYPVVKSANSNTNGLSTVATQTFIASGNKDDNLALIRSGTHPNAGQVGKVSTQNWKLTNYAVNSSYLSNLGDFLSVIKGQKATKTITDLNQIERNKVNIINSPYTITGALPDRGGPYILLVNGALTLNIGAGSTVNTTGDSIALISTSTINIHSTIGQINTILVADSFNLAYDLAAGTNSATPLKINGNLVSANPVDTLRRDRPDFDKPSLFVVFKPKMYLDVLPLLSVTQTGGRQIQ